MNLVRQFNKPASLLLFGFIFLIYFFSVVDIYHLHFFKSGSIVIFYNLMRLLFIFYMGWIFYVIGDFILKRVTRSDLQNQLDSFLLAFFSGFSLSQIFLFFIGLTGLYQRHFINALCLIIFALSLNKLSRFISHVKKINLIGFSIILLPLLGFLITKGLYPAGGHDYYNHYFQYYKKVIETGTTLPNEVWYHFFYSKGAGLFFLSMLITDPLGPQLASTILILGAAGVIFSILRSQHIFKYLPWIGIAFYFTFMIYTPGPLENLHQGGWGDLEKPHEPAAVMVFAILWLIANLIQSDLKKTWGIPLLFSISALIIISPAMAVIVGIYLAFILLFFLLKKQYQNTTWILFAGIVLGSWTLFLLVINYFYTGIPQDQGLFLFWPILNFAKINDWGTLFEVLNTHWLKATLETHKDPFNLTLLTKIISYLRVDMLWPILCAGTFFGVISLFKPSIKDKNHYLVAFGTFIATTAILSLFLSRSQSISFYRFTSFTYAPVLCFSLLLLAIFVKNRIFSPILLAALFLILFSPYKQDGHLKGILQNGLFFATGKYSIADAYRHQVDWPGRMPWGGIYPASEVAWSQLLPNTRVYSFNQHAYCMLPNCRMETYLSYRLSHHADEIYFGNTQNIITLLKIEKLNYFFISTSLQISDPLVLSPLFSPQNIAKYFGFAWTDGENSLLTWKEDAFMPIDKQWLDHYKRQVEEARIAKDFPLREFKKLFTLSNKNHSIKSSEITWPT